MAEWLHGVGRGYLAFLSVYHVITGVMSFAFPDSALVMYRGLYGCNPVERRHVALMLKPWGALAVFAGLCGLYAVGDPVRYRGVVVALVALLALRVVYRVWCRESLRTIGGIAPRRNAISIAALLAGIAVLSGWLIGGRW